MSVFNVGGTLTKLLIALIASPVLAYVCFKLALMREKKKPISILQQELIKEINENGYTDKALQMSLDGIDMYSEKDKGDFVYFIEFVLYGACGYAYREDYENMRRTMDVMDVEKIKAKDISFMDGGRSVISFFDLQMSYCMDTHNKDMAQKVYNDAKSFLDKFYNNALTRVLADEFYVYYHSVNENYDEAVKYAYALIENDLVKQNRSISGHIDLIKVYMASGDKEMALKVPEEAEQISEDSKISTDKNILAKYKEKLM